MYVIIHKHRYGEDYYQIDSTEFNLVKRLIVELVLDSLHDVEDQKDQVELCEAITLKNYDLAIKIYEGSTSESFHVNHSEFTLVKSDDDLCKLASEHLVQFLLE